jgi:hypothetical protein
MWDPADHQGVWPVASRGHLVPLRPWTTRAKVVAVAAQVVLFGVFGALIYLLVSR